MRKRGILIVGVALMIAAAGVVYAHWTETLQVNATVQTGDALILWKKVFTDDDGDHNAYPTQYDIPLDDFETGLDNAEYTFLPATSVDPASPSYPAPAEDRYTKDVADCIAVLDSALAPDPASEHSYGFTLTVTNAYPSYHCTIYSVLGNQGTIPMKVQRIRTTLTLDGVPFFPPGTVDPITGDYQAIWQTLEGHACGEQIDPGKFNTTIAYLHIGQLAPQAPDGGLFEMHQEIDLVNWNEFDASECPTYHSFNP